MPNVTVTIRQVKNPSGLDLVIPTFQEKTQLFRKSVEYNVVAVSNLACFKQRHHKDSDVIQLMVIKRLEDFEELRKKIGTRFPGTLFPPLPQSLFSFVEGTAKEQVAMLEDFLQFIAESSKLSTCADLLQFLGFSTVNAGRTKMGKQSSPAPALLDESDEKIENMFEASQEDEEDDLFGPSHSSQQEKQRDSTGAQLFEDQDYGGEVSKNDELVLIASGAADVDKNRKGSLFDDDSDEEDLLTIEDNLNDILTLSAKKNIASSASQSSPSSTKPKPQISAQKPKLAPKPAGKPSVAPKPGKSKLQSPSTNTGALLSDNLSSKSSRNDSGIGSDDILKYIQENTNNAEEDLDLFS